MNINVKPDVRDHFWHEPPAGSREFWSTGQWPPKCNIGETLYFRFDGVLVATAIADEIEPPFQAQCEESGRFLDGWKVYWKPETFVDVRELSLPVGSCPNCFHDDPVLSDSKRSYQIRWRVKCPNCKYSTKTYLSEFEAILMWNQDEAHSQQRRHG